MATPEALRARLAARPLLLDGGLGSLLIAQGLPPGTAPEHWLEEHPERIEQAHRAYVEAGSDVIHAATFGASPPKLAAAGLAGRGPALNRRAVEIARRAARPETLVAGDIGPSGLLLPPLGTATEDEVRAAYAEQIAELAAAGADLLSLETFYDLREALAALAAAVASGLAVLASMTFESRPRGFFTIMGNPLIESLRALAAGGATAVGFNCSVTAEVMVRMVAAAAGSVAVPLVAQPNAGQPRLTPAGTVYDASAQAFAGDVARLLAAGARIVGGCCGTDPEFIRLARPVVDAAA